MNGPINVGRVRSFHTTLLTATAYELDEAAREAGLVAEDHVRHRSGFKTQHPGGLADETVARVVKTRRGNRLIIGNKKPYAPAQEFGARPHLIAARKAHALSFLWHGHQMFRRWVMHPGNKPLRFLSRAAEAAGAFEIQQIRTRLGRLSRRFAHTRI